MSQTWITKTISEKTKIPDLENKLSVVIKPSKVIAKGDIVTIKGLTSTTTNDNNSIDIKGGFKFNANGGAATNALNKWNQTGALRSHDAYKNSIAMNDNYLFVNGNESSGKKMLIYKKNANGIFGDGAGGTGTFQEIDGDSNATTGKFPYSMSCTNDLMVATWGESGKKGKVYLFKKDSYGKWGDGTTAATDVTTKVAELEWSNTTDTFGGQVDISPNGEFIIVGNYTPTNKKAWLIKRTGNALAFYGAGAGSNTGLINCSTNSGSSQIAKSVAINDSHFFLSGHGTIQVAVGFKIPATSSSTMTYNFNNARDNNQTGNSTTVQYIGYNYAGHEAYMTGRGLVASNDFVVSLYGSNGVSYIQAYIRKKNSDGTYGDGAGNSGFNDFIFKTANASYTWVVDGVDYKAASGATTDGANSVAMADDGAGNVKVLIGNQYIKGTGTTQIGGFYPLEWNGTSFVKRPLVMNDGDLSGTTLTGSYLAINNNADIVSVNSNGDKSIQYKSTVAAGNGKGIWTKSTGTLALRVETAIDANETLSFNFNLTNGDISRNPIVPTVEVNGANSTSATAMSTGILGYNWPRPRVGVEGTVWNQQHVAFGSLDQYGILQSWGRGVEYGPTGIKFNPPTDKRYKLLEPHRGVNAWAYCGIDMEGGLYCWAQEDKMGQDIGVEWHNTGTGYDVASATIKGVDNSGNLKSGVKKVLGNKNYWLALKENGDLYGWGRVMYKSGKKNNSLYDLSGAGTFNYTNVKDIYVSDSGVWGGLFAFIKNDGNAYFFGSFNAMKFANIGGVKTTDSSVTTMSNVKQIFPVTTGMWILHTNGTVSFKGGQDSGSNATSTVTIKEYLWNTSHADFEKVTHITTIGGGNCVNTYMWREDGTICSNNFSLVNNKTKFPFMADKTHSTFKKMKDLFVHDNKFVIAVDEDNTAYITRGAGGTGDWYKSDDSDQWTRDCSNQSVNPVVDYRIYANVKDVCFATSGGNINIIDTDGNLFGGAVGNGDPYESKGGALMWSDNSANLISKKWDSLYPGDQIMWGLDLSGGVYPILGNLTESWSELHGFMGKKESGGKTSDISGNLKSGVSIVNSHNSSMTFIKENGDVYSIYLNPYAVGSPFVWQSDPASTNFSAMGSDLKTRLNLGAGNAKGSNSLQIRNHRASFVTYYQNGNFNNEPRAFKRGAAAAEDAGFYNTIRVAALQKAVVTQTVGGKKRAKKDDTDLLAALAAMKAEISRGSASGATSKKKKRRAALKLIFEATAGVVQIPMKKTDLALPATFKKTEVLVVKAGQTVDVGSIEDESDTKDVGFYTILEEGEKISLKIAGKTFIVKRTDDGSNERYVIDSSGTAVFTEKTGCANWDDTLPHLGYLVDGDVFTAEGHTFFIGSVGDGGQNEEGTIRDITVGAATGGGNAFYYGGDEAPTLIMTSGNTYTFNYPAAHPLKFSDIPDGTHSGGTMYNTGVTYVSNTQLTINITNYSPSTLYYYCKNHSGMGGMIDVQYGASGGDPYVKPMKGPTYKLPNKKAYYRLYEKDDVFINGAVKEIDESRKKSIHKYFNNNKSEVNPVVVEGYFYSGYYISVGNKEFVIDLKTFVFLTSKNAKEFFKFKMTKEYVNGTWDNGKALCLNISWKHHEYGTMSLDILKYENPQIDSMIRMKRYPSIENTVGTLVRNYKPKLMEIEKLDSTKSGKIAKKLLKAKNKFINKAYMQKGETWTIDGKSYDFNQINNKI